MKETKRQQQKRETRARIISFARQVFSEYGFSVPTSEIAKAAGVSHGTIFLHFPTREELICCTVEDFFENLNLKVHTAAKASDSIIDLLYLHLEILSEYEDFYRNVITQMTELPSGMQEKLFAHQAALSFHFEQAFLADAQKAKDTDIPFYMLFNMWHGLVHYYLQNHTMFAPSGSVIERYKNELVKSYGVMIGIQMD